MMMERNGVDKRLLAYLFVETGKAPVFSQKTGFCAAIKAITITTQIVISVSKPRTSHCQGRIRKFPTPTRSTGGLRPAKGEVASGFVGRALAKVLAIQ